jgi:hypothetical protein
MEHGLLRKLHIRRRPRCLDGDWSGYKGRGTAASTVPGNGGNNPPADHHLEPKEVVGRTGPHAAPESQGVEDARQPPATLPTAGADQPWRRR